MFQTTATSLITLFTVSFFSMATLTQESHPVKRDLAVSRIKPAIF